MQHVPGADDEVLALDKVSLTDLLNSSRLTDQQRVLWALRAEIPPDQLSHLLVLPVANGGWMRYADLYEAFQQRFAELTAENPQAKWGQVARELLGLSKNQLNVLNRQAHRAVQKALADLQ